MPYDSDQLMLDVDMIHEENKHPQTVSASQRGFARPTTAVVLTDGHNTLSQLEVKRQGKRACQGDGPRNGAARRLGANLNDSNASTMMSSSSLSTNITMNSTADSVSIQRDIAVQR